MNAPRITSLDLIADELVEVVEFFAARLRLMEDTVVSQRPKHESVSTIELLGQLVDSAANHHQYFVRALTSDAVDFPSYDRSSWVKCQQYNECSWDQLIEFWRLYNLQLAHIVRRIPDEKMRVKCTISPNQSVSLSFLVEEYMSQMKLILNKISERPGI